LPASIDPVVRFDNKEQSMPGLLENVDTIVFASAVSRATELHERTNGEDPVR
jgi:hypothetical protein